MNGDAPPRGTFLREPRHVVSALRLLVLAGLTMLGIASPPAEPHLYWFITIVYAVTIFGYLWASNRAYSLERVRWLVFLFDVAMVSGLTVLRGQHSTEFLAAYFGLVLMAAMAEGLGNAVTNAIIISAAYAVLTRWGVSPDQFLSFETVTHFVFFFIIAVFMGHMATGVRAEARNRKRAQEALRQTSSRLESSTAALKVARESLRANDRLATLGMLSAGIAHEMRNPLAAIISCFEPAEEILSEIEEAAPEGGGSEATRELRSIIADCRIASDQLLGVARDLTSAARGGAVEAVAVRPRESFEACLRILRSRIAGRVRVETHVSAAHAALADPARLLQILLNLAGNALDAMEGQETQRLVLRAEDDGDHVDLFVEDTGPGIPEEVRTQIFEPFFTTKPSGKGTGLGLHVVSEIVKAHGGTIGCDTAPTGGARFRLRLPAHEGARERNRNNDQSRANAADRRRRGVDSPGSAENAEEAAVPVAARV